MLLIRHCQSSHLLSLLFSYLHTTINFLSLQAGSQRISESQPVSLLFKILHIGILKAYPASRYQIVPHFDRGGYQFFQFLRLGLAGFVCGFLDVPLQVRITFQVQKAKPVNQCHSVLILSFDRLLSQS